MVINDLTNTEWYFAADLTYSGTSPSAYWTKSVDFMSNNVEFKAIQCTVNQANGKVRLQYVRTDSSVPTLVYDYDTQWADEAYRTIGISGGTDVTDTDLIEYLEEFADRVIENLTGTAWLLNEELVGPGGSSQTSKSYIVDFRSSGEIFQRFYWQKPTTGRYRVAYYYSSGVNVVVYINGILQADPSYRKIMITGGRDVNNIEFIEWLKANAVQIPPEFQVTYNVVNGTWSDSSTAAKTEIVHYGGTTAEVPEGMVPNEGYGNGSWDNNPVGVTVEDDMEFTYTFHVTEFTITYEVENGTWSDGTDTPISETVNYGDSPANIPEGMLPDVNYTGGEWHPNPSEAVITSNAVFVYRFEPVRYTVTYEVVNGKWSDGTTAHKTESVIVGESPAEIPESMIPDAGYHDGSWNPDPSGATISGDTTFTYTFVVIPPAEYTATYRVVNGTWSDGTTTPKTESVLSGSQPSHIPEGMIPDDGYEGGSWDKSPYSPMYDNEVFTFTFSAVSPGPGPGPVTGLNYFTFDGENSVDFGVYIGGQFTYNAPQRDITKISIPGRNGDLIQDNGRFLNVQVPYSVVVMEEFLDRTDEIKAWLLSKKGYCRLTDTYHPDTFRWGRVSGGIDFTTGAFNLTGKSKIIFDCKPQRFLVSGEELVSVSGSVENPTRFESNPFIHIEGSGAGELTIGNTIIRITDIAGYVDIDCEAKVISKGPEPKAHTVILPNYVFPTLAPGVNNISYSGGITSVGMKGNWWTI